jgi:hypothetical protein
MSGARGAEFPSEFQADPQADPQAQSPGRSRVDECRSNACSFTATDMVTNAAVSVRAALRSFAAV